MAWTQESLWTKARLFAERAFDQQDNTDHFGLWAALALELLARSSLASVSPALLAEPDPNHANLLHALGRGTASHSAKSVGTTQVLELCRKLFSGSITQDDVTNARALINRRNEELHTGAAAFSEYPTDKWLVGFHRICKALCEAQGRTLADFYGADEAAKASDMINEATEETKGRIKSLIASHRKVFEQKSPDERDVAKNAAEKLAHEAHWQGKHKVTCPACSSAGCVVGENYGRESVALEHDAVAIKQPMIPRSFRCLACGLHLRNFGELDAAGLGGRYISTSYDSVAGHFGLEDPSDRDEYEMPYMDE
jgi:hypothetical protein